MIIASDTLSIDKLLYTYAIYVVTIFFVSVSS